MFSVILYLESKVRGKRVWCLGHISYGNNAIQKYLLVEIVVDVVVVSDVVLIGTDGATVVVVDDGVETVVVPDVVVPVVEICVVAEDVLE